LTKYTFEKRVIELFLASTDSPHDLEGKKYLLNEYGDDIIRGEYKMACYYYDDLKSPDNEFTDEGLLMQPVRILEMI